MSGVLLGAFVEKNWRFKDAEHLKSIVVVGSDFYQVISLEEKAQFRVKLVEAMLTNEDQKILNQYLRCLRKIVFCDYPESWPELLPTIKELLNTDQEKTLKVGLLCLVGACQKYEFEYKPELRQNLNLIVSETYPMLGSLVNNLTSVQPSEQILSLIKLVCKVFYVCNQIEICPFLGIDNTLNSWMDLMNNILRMPLPEELESKQTSLEQKEKHLFWQIKKIVAKTCYRILLKYSKEPKEQIQQEIAKKLQQSYFITFLEACMLIIFKTETNYVQEKTLNNTLKYVQYCLQKHQYRSYIEPSIERLLTKTLIPIMIITPQDEQQFEEDPIEIIKKSQELTCSYQDQKLSALDLIERICQLKDSQQNSQYFNIFIKFCMEHLNAYDWKEKEALMHIIGKLRYKISENKKEFPNLEELFITNILPELNSNQGLMKRRAIQVYGEFGGELLNEAHVCKVVEVVAQNLKNQNLCIQVAAGINLPLILSKDKYLTIIEKELPEIFNSYLHIIHQVESEELVSGLEEMVGRFQDKIIPYAIDITKSLIESYKKLIKQAEEDEEEEGEATLAAQGCITTIKRIVSAVKSRPDILLQLETLTFPIILHTMTPDGVETIEDTLEIVTFFVHYSQQGLSQSLWKLFPYLIYLVAGNIDSLQISGNQNEQGVQEVEGYGIESQGQVSVIIQNYIQKDPKTFVNQLHGLDQPIRYFDLTLNYLIRIIKINQKNENKLGNVHAMKILVAMVENIAPGIEQCQPDPQPPILNKITSEYNVQVVLQLSLGQLKTSEQDFLQRMVLQVILTCFWRNAALTLKALEQFQMLQLFYQKLAETMNAFQYKFEIRRVIFGLLAIIRTPFSQIPSLILQCLPQIASWITFLCVRSSSLRQNELKDMQIDLDAIKTGQNNDDSDKEDDGRNFQFEQELWMQNPEIYEMFRDQLEDLSKGMASSKKTSEDGKEPTFEDEEEEEYEINGSDLLFYKSPLDPYDELLEVKNTLEQIAAADMQTYQKLMEQVNEKGMQKLQEALSSAEQLCAKEKALQKQLEEWTNYRMKMQNQ